MVSEIKPGLRETHYTAQPEGAAESGLMRRFPNFSRPFSPVVT